MNSRFSCFQKILGLVLDVINLNNKFLRYIISGSTATVVNLAVVWLARQLTDYSVAVSVGAIAGAATTYLLTKNFVFNATKRALDHAEIIRFLLVHTIVCIQIWIVSVSLVRWILPAHWDGGLREAIASFIGVGSVVLTGFFLHQHITFRAIPAKSD